MPFEIVISWRKCRREGMSTRIAAARVPRERLSSLKNPHADRRVSLATPSAAQATATSSSSLRNGASNAGTSGTGAGRAQVRRACPNPECNTPDIQEIDGERACISCGTIINDSNIVAEVTFGESSAGAAVVQGGFVGEGQRHARSVAPGFRRPGGHGESREITEYHGREEIRKLGSAIRVFQSIEDQAFSIYKLAAANNFIQGRRTRSVAAVCLYVACRRDKNNTILLMDLAELIQVNIFKLGEVYKDLMKDLWLGDFSQSGVTPVIEVEPLILKFARKLEFGNQYRKVAEDAVKILKRMKRDWMVTGRRPAGLCGACIILAARMNNYRRTVREVVYVVKVADMTIAKRLEEFERTRSSTLTVEEFRKYGLLLKQQHDPPALYNAARRKEKKRKSSERINRSGEDTPAEESTEQGPLAGAGQSREQPRRDADGFVVPDRPIDPNLLAASNLAHSELQAMSTTSDKRRQRAEETGSSNGDNGDNRKKKRKAEPLPLTPQDLIVEEELETEINQIITDPETLTTAAEEAYASTHDRAKALAEQMRGRSAVRADEEIDPDEFADDPEVSNCVLSPEEITIKERIWVTHNEDWLRAQQAKILKKTLEEASGGGGGAGVKKNGNKKKQKRSRMGDGSVLEGGDPILTPADANQRMLMKRSKGFSKLINYEKLNKIYEGFVGELEGGSGGADTGSGTSEGGAVASASGAAERNMNASVSATSGDRLDDHIDAAGSSNAATDPASSSSAPIPNAVPTRAPIAPMQRNTLPPNPTATIATTASGMIDTPSRAPLPTPPNTQLQAGSAPSPPTTHPPPLTTVVIEDDDRNDNRKNTGNDGAKDGEAEAELEEIDDDDDDEDEEEEEEDEEEEDEPNLNQVVDEFGVVRDDDDDDEGVDEY